jgi:hypothetical protein
MVKCKATETRTRKLAPVENDDSMSLGNISNMSSYISYHRETLKQSQTPKPKEKPKERASRKSKTFAKVAMKESAFQESLLDEQNRLFDVARPQAAKGPTPYLPAPSPVETSRLPNGSAANAFDNLSDDDAQVISIQTSLPRNKRLSKLSGQRTETPDVEPAPEPKVLFDAPKKTANVRQKQREKQTKRSPSKTRHLATKGQMENDDFEPRKSRERDTRRSTSPVIKNAERGADSQRTN